jgi:hypothetical protein
MKPLDQCANGCPRPPSPPSKVICRECQDRITAKLERWAGGDFTDDRAEPEEQDGLECDCCGDVGAYPDANGCYSDGQELICGCPGWVSIDDAGADPAEHAAWINNDWEPCPKCEPEEFVDA